MLLLVLAELGVGVSLICSESSFLPFLEADLRQVVIVDVVVVYDVDVVDIFIVVVVDDDIFIVVVVVNYY